MRRLVCLAAVHDDIVPVETAETLFGDELVREAEKSGAVMREDGYFGEGSRAVARKKRKISKSKFRKAEEMLHRLESIPWVRFAAVTGSVSHGSAAETDDIDIFVVADNNRLWLTRLAEQIILRKKGVRRRYREKDLTDKICVNFYTSGNRLDLSRSEENAFMAALEIAMMKPVVNSPYYARILKENPWVREYFPGVAPGGEWSEVEPQLSRRSFFGDMLDFLCMHASLLYMRLMRHPVGEVVVERNRIEFFDRDVWEKKRREWNALLELDDAG